MSRQTNSTEQPSENESTVIGRNALRELLASGRDIDKIFTLAGERDISMSRLLAQARERKIPVIAVEKTRLDALANHEAHQGVVCMVAEQNYASIDDMLKAATEKGEKPLLVIADGIEDPHNLGAIIRSAECAGAHGVIIPKRRAVGLTAAVSKSSAGALSYLPIAKVTNLPSAIDELKEKGLWIYAADMSGSPVYESDLKGAAAFVFGAEGDGISRLVHEKCDFTVSIPLYGHVNSLNVSNAAAVILCEAARQRHL